jgi:hypothetical protein
MLCVMHRCIHQPAAYQLAACSTAGINTQSARLAVVQHLPLNILARHDAPHCAPPANLKQLAALVVQHTSQQNTDRQQQQHSAASHAITTGCERCALCASVVALEDCQVSTAINACLADLVTHLCSAADTKPAAAATAEGEFCRALHHGGCLRVCALAGVGSLQPHQGQLFLTHSGFIGCSVCCYISIKCHDVGCAQADPPSALPFPCRFAAFLAQPASQAAKAQRASGNPTAANTASSCSRPKHSYTGGWTGSPVHVGCCHSNVVLVQSSVVVGGPTGLLVGLPPIEDLTKLITNLKSPTTTRDPCSMACAAPAWPACAPCHPLRTYRSTTSVTCDSHLQQRGILAHPAHGHVSSPAAWRHYRLSGGRATFCLGAQRASTVCQAGQVLQLKG